jgi:hypothetical protein
MSRPRPPSIKTLVLEYLERNHTAEINVPELAALRRHVAASAQRAKPISDRYLLDILLATDIPITRSLGGVPPDLRGRVHFADAERAAASLLEMLEEYRRSRTAGDALRAEDCRRAVRLAKDRLRLVLRRPNLSPSKRQEKEELLQWFLVWLETPDLFDQWLDLRRSNPPADREAE